ncbi:MAG: hypothetical protein Ct9H300mP8_02650 [Gammaproteobacteria bacterium]|nr:MAG: hypothetical protein Ct9H300mP8_02650 [Gammaproteobacteria bacterium]
MGQSFWAPVDRNGSELSIRLNNVTLRFVESTDGRGPGLSGLDLAVANKDQILERARQRGAYVSDDEVLVCGTRFYLHQV